MTKIYEIVTSILQNATDYIQNGMYQASHQVFDNAFFNIAFALSVVYIGFMIAFKKFSNEEVAYRFIWLIVAYAGTIRTASRFTSGHSAGVDSDS